MIKLTMFSLLLFFASATMAQPAVKPDNSGTNKRIEQNSEMTAQDQSSGANDTEITRKIRQDVVADKKVSIYGQNVKIISDQGVVTLKGPVHTAAEKSEIGMLAKKYAKNHTIHNELEITK